MSAEAIDLPNTSLTTLDGKSIQLNKFIGEKPVYIKFWATWCIPCREQMPHFQHTYETYGKQIEMVAINLNMNETLEAVKQVKNEFKLTMPIALDKDAQFSQAVDLKFTPFHVLINKQGKVIHTGHDADDKLDSKIKSLAQVSSKQYKEVNIKSGATKSDLALLKSDKPTLLFFASAWCDSYIKESRPTMSAKCIEAQHQVNKLAKQYPQFNWQGVLTRLWTVEKDLDAYKERYAVPFDFKIDDSNTLFFNYKVDSFPTLVAVKNGKEQFRTQSFSDLNTIISQLNKLGDSR